MGKMGKTGGKNGKTGKMGSRVKGDIGNLFKEKSHMAVVIMHLKTLTKNPSLFKAWFSLPASTVFFCKSTYFPLLRPSS